MTDWTILAATLADKLTAAGKLRSPEWQAALRAVPRHELVPVHYTMDPHTGAWTAAYTADDLPRVYSNTALFHAGFDPTLGADGVLVLRPHRAPPRYHLQSAR